MAILDWTIGPTYIMTLLACQHEQKVEEGFSAVRTAQGLMKCPFIAINTTASQKRDGRLPHEASGTFGREN